ncbi:hypothetical protein DRQ09_06860 [candidate division KSB1 bacterium]|nr:MAG: hypothetical protein DRQ09_06860 [candidate division KSB1 bacterium]
MKNEGKKPAKKYHYFDNPQVCAGCHWDRFDRWNVSQHSKAYTGDFFQKQFFEFVLPSRDFDKKVADINTGCIGCHAPVSFLSGVLIPEPSEILDNHWNRGKGNKTLAERGVFCDFCHTLEGFKNEQPFNFDYISSATEEIDSKKAGLEFPWSPYHDTDRSEIFEGTGICATCHNELNPYGVWVKATEREYSKTEYPERGIVCQTCHMQPMSGKPAKMGPLREENHNHWLGGGFTEFVEGAAKINIFIGKTEVKPGEKFPFKVFVHDVATGHKFPTGSVEERDVWLHVTICDKNGKDIEHIRIPENPDNPYDKYFITSNDKVAYPSHSKLSKPFERDALPEGDRIYHSAFIDSEGKFTYAQWFAVEEIENRLEPLEVREEKYILTVPENVSDSIIYIKAVLNYRRMPDSFADFLEIDRRPAIEVSRDRVMLKVIK